MLLLYHSDYPIVDDNVGFSLYFFWSYLRIRALGLDFFYTALTTAISYSVLGSTLADSCS